MAVFLILAAIAAQRLAELASCEDKFYAAASYSEQVCDLLNRAVGVERYSAAYYDDGDTW